MLNDGGSRIVTPTIVSGPAPLTTAEYTAQQTRYVATHGSTWTRSSSSSSSGGGSGNGPGSGSGNTVGSGSGSGTGSECGGCKAAVVQQQYGPCAYGVTNISPDCTTWENKATNLQKNSISGLKTAMAHEQVIGGILMIIGAILSFFSQWNVLKAVLIAASIINIFAQYILPNLVDVTSNPSWKFFDFVIGVIASLAHFARAINVWLIGAVEETAFVAAKAASGGIVGVLWSIVAFLGAGNAFDSLAIGAGSFLITLAQTNQQDINDESKENIFQFCSGGYAAQKCGTVPTT